MLGVAVRSASSSGRQPGSTGRREDEYVERGSGRLQRSRRLSRMREGPCLAVASMDRARSSSSAQIAKDLAEDTLVMRNSAASHRLGESMRSSMKSKVKIAGSDHYFTSEVRATQAWPDP